MISTETNIRRIGTDRLRASVAVPFVVSGASVRDARFVSVSSGWLFQEAETPAGSTLDFFVGSPVSGTLIVEQPNDVNSIFYLTSLDSQKYRLAGVLTVFVEKSGDQQYIASEPQRGWFGYGDTEEYAVGQFAAALVEELEILSEREDHLSVHLQSELAQLRQIVLPKR